MGIVYSFIVILFPSPREVEGLYHNKMKKKLERMMCFRPLSRLIGLYLTVATAVQAQNITFPSPLEVNRFISQVFQKPIILTLKFPSPREVNRFISQKLLKRACLSNTFPPPLEVNRSISKDINWLIYIFFTTLPSPLEVDRFISLLWHTKYTKSLTCFRPLSR